MSLSTYKAFLASLSASALADDVSLHYITTLTSIQGATAVSKHFSVQEKFLKKKGEKVLSAVDGGNSLAVDVETTIEFVQGGGAYLPGLDDNFVADRTVTFPMVCLLLLFSFASHRPIASVRDPYADIALRSTLSTSTSRARSNRSACIGTKALS